ncbi:hypothetical protein [Flavobacterium branchiicola]|uniref:Ig-like domain-containing protein n=1 Tax=Flavobacterium branchiicola TaxID=1114875 RepID=A0ABV9PAJ8_9FLAO|nr:hypothetical protein [Flavobacterium branchiicola]MBS7253183.1 hypothetical protein [Flavobacterium branchiicola]
MKKKYLLFFILLSIKFYGQTYNFNITYGLLCNTCWQGPTGPSYNSYSASNFRWTITNNAAIIAKDTDNGYVDYGKIVKNYANVNIANGNTIKVAINSNGMFHTEDGTGFTCNTNTSVSKKIDDLIADGSVGFSDSPCGLTSRISNFIPNIAIKNLDTQNPTTICAGAQLSLSAFSTNDTGIFPATAYHWQYSVDQTTWTDLPANINNTPNPVFSIQQILNQNHASYLKKKIYFRLGYVNRPFTAPFELTYSPCAPVITSVTYEGPKCSQDPIQSVTVTFDRPLNTSIGESLDRIKVVQVPSEIQTNEYIDITSFGPNNTYTFKNLTQIENGKTYKIVYQAKITNPLNPNDKGLAGFMESTLPDGYFTYADPTKVEFKITDQIQPSCAGGNDGVIGIEVKGGAKDYKFYVDGTLTTAIYNAANNKYYINGCKAKTYDIKVTDKFDCIDKTAM